MTIAAEPSTELFDFAPEKGALNQYWYSDNTINALAGQRIDTAIEHNT